MESEKKKILICEDEKGVQESLKLILEDDYELVITDNGPDAIAKVQESDFAVALLDIKLPKMDGLEILRGFKTIKSSLPVIMVTGYQSMEIAQEALKDGAFDYIPKPIDSDQLRKAISSAIGS